MWWTKKVIFLYLSLSAYSIFCASLNLVVFSFDRPLQLYAFLESFEYNTKGCERISIIYKTSSQEFAQGYELVKNRFPYIEFIQQAPKSKIDFKPLTLKAVGFDKEEYIVFAVDDIVVTRPIDFDEVAQILELINCTGFYLRLGQNITECYSENKVTGTPSFKEVMPGVFSWHFKNGQGDWSYPHTVDMTVYKKNDIKESFLKLHYNCPNILEGNWAGVAPKHKAGLCYKNATIVNCPLNVVQKIFNNRNSDELSPEELLDLFMKGYKLDILPLQNIMNKSPHMDYKPTFIPR